MSLNKKYHNYSGLLGELKSSSINDKIKGRNYKMHMKRVTTDLLDKSDIVGLKGLREGQNIPLHSQNGLQAQSSTKKLLVMDSLNLNLKNPSIDKRLLDKRRVTGTSSNNLNTNSEIPPNKIDIKISVNYGKPTSATSSNTLVNNTNVSSNLSTSKSKSFYQNSNVNFVSNNPSTINSNNISTDYNTHGQSSSITNQLKEKLINSLKTTIKDEKVTKKKIINKENSEYLEGSQSVNYSTSNIHKRIQSESGNFYQNNLNISLMNYENKQHPHFNQNYITNNKTNTTQNNSFLYNPTLYSHFHNDHNDDLTPKRRNDTVMFETNPNIKIDTLDNLNTNQNLTTQNINDFTLNRNDNDFLQVVNTTINHSGSNANLNSPLKPQLAILESKMEDMLTSVINENSKEKDKMNLVSKKFYVFKNVLEDYIKIVHPESGCNPGKNILSKINEGYNDTFNMIIAGYSKLNDKMSDYETITSNYKTVSKKFSELYKSYQDKNEEIKSLKSKILQITQQSQNQTQNHTSQNHVSQNHVSNNVENNNAQINATKSNNKNEAKNVLVKNSSENPLNVSSNLNSLTQSQIYKSPNLKTNNNNNNVKIEAETNTQNINNNINTQNNQNNINNQNKPNSNSDQTAENEIEKNNRNRMITMINKNLLDDLDAIYFFDKINMRANSASHNNVPKLDLNFLQPSTKQKKREDLSNNVSNNASNNQCSGVVKATGAGVNYTSLQQSQSQYQYQYQQQQQQQQQNLNIKKIQNLKIDDLSFPENNSKLLAASNNTTVNKNQVINKISYHNTSVKNSNGLSLSVSNYNTGNNCSTNNINTVNKKLAFDEKGSSSKYLSSQK